MERSNAETHSDHIRLAKIDEWEVAKTGLGRPIRKAAYVAPPDSEGCVTADSSDDEAPLVKLARKYRKVRDDSEDEEDIHLFEVGHRLQARKLRERAMRTSDLIPT